MSCASWLAHSMLLLAPAMSSHKYGCGAGAGCKCNKCEKIRTYNREYRRAQRNAKAPAPTKSGTIVERSHPPGAACLGCGMTEGKCALNGCECCDKCTHMFGESGRKYICRDCEQVHTQPVAAGAIPQRCPRCTWYHNQRRSQQYSRQQDVAS